MSGSIKILWPDGPRSVSLSKILSWARDSYYNNAPAYRCLACGLDTMVEGGCRHDADSAPVYPPGTVEEPRSCGAAIEWLAETGEVTFAEDGE